MKRERIGEERMHAGELTTDECSHRTLAKHTKACKFSFDAREGCVTTEALEQHFAVRDPP